MMSAMALPPTGEQHEISYDQQVAVVTEQGATLRRYDVEGRPVVDGFDLDQRPDGGRGQVLAPWPNRVRDGRWSFAGEEHQLALTEVAKGNAIHGLVRWGGWQAIARETAAVTMATTVWPQPGYPFRLRLQVSYRLGDGGLTVTTEAANESDRPAPYAVGHHPYVTAGGTVEETVLTVPAVRRLLVDERGNPVGGEDVAGTAYDFTTPRRVGDLVLDTAYAGLVHDGPAAPAVRLEHDGRTVEVWLGEGVRLVQVFSGDTLPDPSRRRQSLAVEAMSGPPGALASGDDLVVLEPGATHRLQWGIGAR